MIHCKRVYEPVEPGDGQRLLVDRLWPRHWRKDQLHGQWVAQVAPSDALRKALHQGELDFPTFAARYRQELAGSACALVLHPRPGRQGAGDAAVRQPRSPAQQRPGAG